MGDAVSSHDSDPPKTRVLLNEAGGGPSALDFLLVASPIIGGSIPPGHTLCVPIVVEEVGLVVAWQFQTQGKYSTFSFGATFVSSEASGTGIYYTPLDEDGEDANEQVWRARAGSSAGADNKAGAYSNYQGSDNTRITHTSATKKKKAKEVERVERVEVITPQARVLCHERVAAGSFTAVRAGTCILSFDNSYSWTRQKEIFFRAGVFEQEAYDTARHVASVTKPHPSQTQPTSGSDSTAAAGRAAGGSGSVDSSAAGKRAREVKGNLICMDLVRTAAESGPQGVTMAKAEWIQPAAATSTAKTAAAGDADPQRMLLDRRGAQSPVMVRCSKCTH
jgi:hypothetical protein